LGPMFDLLGRKKILVFGQIIAAVGYFLIPSPIFGSLYHNDI